MIYQHFSTKKCFHWSRKNKTSILWNQMNLMNWRCITLTKLHTWFSIIPPLSDTEINVTWLYTVRTFPSPVKLTCYSFLFSLGEWNSFLQVSNLDEDRNKSALPHHQANGSVRPCLPGVKPPSLLAVGDGTFFTFPFVCPLNDRN